MYRTAAVTAPPDALVPCRACAHEKAVALDAQRHDTFECAKCRLEQPVLRAGDDLEVTDLVFVSLDSSRHEELDPFLATLGQKKAGSAAQITLRCDGIQIQISLSINSGSVVGLEMVADATGLPAVTFERETDAHREAESKGIVKELQTGDASFDEQVYVASDAAEADVTTVLASPAARKAIQQLLSAGTVRIAAGSVKIFISTSDQPFHPKHIRDRLGSLRALAGAPRRSAPTHVELPPLVKLVTALSFTLMPIGVLSTILGARQYTPMNATPWLTGVAIGLVIAALLQPLVTRALKGRSTSLSDIGRTRAIVFSGLPVVTTGFLFIANGALDPSEAKRVEMPVVKASIDDDDSSKIDVTARDDIGETHVYSFAAPVPGKSSYVVIRINAGRLGWRWYRDPVELVRKE